MGKAKPTLPGEIEAKTRYANIIYLVYKWQSWSVLASAKNREKPKGRKVIREIVCWFPRSSLSSCWSWNSSNMTWALGYWVLMPTVFFLISFSSEHGISDSGRFFFLSTILVEKMQQRFSYSSHLGSKQHCREAAAILIHFTVQLLHACVCTFYSMVQLPKAAAGRDQHWPNLTSDIRHPRCDWELVFSLFSPCPRHRQPTWTHSKLTGLLFGKGRANNGYSGALPHVTGREKPVLGHREPSALGPWRRLCFQAEAVVCPACGSRLLLVCDGGSFVLLPGCLQPLAVMPSVTHGLCRKDHPSCLQKHQITPRLCWRGAIVFQAGKSYSSNKL